MFAMSIPDGNEGIVTQYADDSSSNACALSTPTQEIPYSLNYSPKRKRILIRITEFSQVEVFAPLGIHETYVQKFLLEKSSWILDKLKNFRTTSSFNNNSLLKVSAKKWESGQEFLFLGKKFPLNVLKDGSSEYFSTRLLFDGSGWVVNVPEALSNQDRQKQIKDRFGVWYRMQAKEILGSRVFHYSRLMGVAPKTIAIKTQKRLWGSCNYRKQTINLNWQIIMSPLEVIDYVVVHELSHLKIPNHSKMFWKNVANILPDYQKQRLWLRSNQRDMTLS